MTIPPTPQMAQCLSAIRRLTQDGIPPTYRELAGELGLSSPSGVHRLLKAMEDRGLVRWTDRRARSLQIAGGPNYGAMPTSELLNIQREVEAVLANRGSA